MDPQELSPDTQVENEKKPLKRKFSEMLKFPSEPEFSCTPDNIREQVNILKATLSLEENDRLAAKNSAFILSEFAKDDSNVDMIMEEGAVDALVSHLLTRLFSENEITIPYECEVEKEVAHALGYLSDKPENQRIIADAGAITGLVYLLKIQPTENNSSAIRSMYRRATDAITTLAHENHAIKTQVRIEGAIPLLIKLLEYPCLKVQRSSAGALRTLAFKNEGNKNLIMECGALPTLILMLSSEDTGVHYEAVGVIGNLVHSSINIKKQVLEEGALQPVIRLLSSKCFESQREAALLLGQFATVDLDCKVKIVQRGAVGPLLRMLKSFDIQVKEMATFALGRLAQNYDNQAGICYDGGLKPLLELLESKNGSVQHNAAFAFYGLADNEDNVAEIIKEGGVQRLVNCELIVQASKDCVQKTLKRLEDKITGKVLKHLIYLMNYSNKDYKIKITIALAHLCSEEDQRQIFIHNNGLELLLDISVSPKHVLIQKDAAIALFTLAKRSSSLSPLDITPPPPTPQVYLGEEFVNNNVMSDVTFLVEGKKFYAHRIALLASSDAFRAMFDGGYREKQESDIEIPNISYKVFELMMKCIYTGTVEIDSAYAHELLQAADQYLLDGLKRLCEYAIAQDMTIENVEVIYELALTYHAMSLCHTCVIFVLQHFEEMTSIPGFHSLLLSMVPEIKNYMLKVLRPRDD